MALTELMGESASGGVPCQEKPVVIVCDWNTLDGNKMQGVVDLIRVAAFQRSFIQAGSKEVVEAYVVLRGVRDDGTSEEFRDRILDAYAYHGKNNANG